MSTDPDCYARAMGSAELGDVFGEGRGGYVLRAPPKGPISLNRYAPGGRTRVDQIQRAVRTGIREEPRALAYDHGIDDEVELVNQVIGEQPSEEDAAAGHKQVALLLRLQITDGHGDVARQDSRARPLRVGEGRRCHVLGPAIQCEADRACRHVRYRSPGAGEDLVRPTAEEERGCTTVDLIEIVRCFGVDKGRCPSAAIEAATAILARSAQPLDYAVHRDIGRRRQPHVVVTPCTSVVRSSGEVAIKVGAVTGNLTTRWL